MKLKLEWRKLSFEKVVDGGGSVLGLAAVLACGLLIVSRPYLIIPEPDTLAYFQMGKAFSKFSWPEWAADPFLFHGHQYITVGEGRVMAKYMPGYPLLLALGYVFGGSLGGAMWVNHLLGIITALAFWRLARHFYGSVTAFVCTVAFLTAPMTFFFMVYPLTHSADLCFSILAMLFAVRYAKYGRLPDAALLGLTAGFMPWTRPTNVLLWPAVVLMYYYARRQVNGAAEEERKLSELWGHWRGLVLGWWEKFRAWLRSWRENWRQAAAVTFRKPGRNEWVLLAAFALPVLALVVFNCCSFGAPWRTGYAFSGEQSAFTLKLGHIGAQLRRLGTGRNLLLGDAFFLLMFLGLTCRGFLRLFLVWALPTVLVYATYYYYSPGTPYMRFFLVLMPAAVLAGGNFLDRWFKRPAAKLAAMLGLLLWFGLFPPPALHVHLKALRNDYNFGRLDHQTVYHPAIGTVKPRSRDSLLGLEQWINEHLKPKDKPVVVYGSSRMCWHTGAMPGVTAYELKTWRTADTWPGGRYPAPLGQKSRQEAFAKIHRDLGRAGLQQHFRDHVKAQLDRGCAVLFMPTRGRMAEWLTEEPGFALEEVTSYSTVSYYGRRTYAIYQVKLKPE